MPFSRPTLSQIISACAADIAAAIPGADALLRFSNLGIFAKIFSGLAHLHYGYQDWIAKQAVPFTSDGEYLLGWAALKKVIQKPAVAASGSVLFINSTPTRTIDIGTPIVRADGVTYTVTVPGTVDGGGNVTVVVAAVDPGANGNCDVGVQMTLGIAIPGIQSSGLVSVACDGGADTESTEDLRTRMLAVYRDPPQGGAASDYPEWALEVPGVTRAWCSPNGAGAGTVIVYFMEDDAEAIHGGFPQGTNGVATAEPRDSAATGDQLVVANHIYPLQPVTALVYSAAPTNNAVAFDIGGLSGAPMTVKNNVEAALADVFFRKGSPGGVYLSDGSTAGEIDLSEFEGAITSVAGTSGFIIVNPTTNVTSAIAALPTLGTVTFV